MLLPCQDFPLRSDFWANIVGNPNVSMGLLGVNKQISDEAQEALYGSTTFTIGVSEAAITLLNFPKLRTYHPIILSPIPTMSSIRFTKHCQVTICSVFYTMSRFYEIYCHIQEKILTASIELVKIPDLQTLKVSFACLCRKIKNEEEPTADVIREAISTALEPLRQVCGKGKISFIAAKPYHIHYMGEDKLAKNLEHPGAIGIVIKSFANTQCQKPACISFAKSFTELKGILEATTTPSTLIPWQIQWLELKACVLHNFSRIGNIYFGNGILTTLWEALHFGTDATAEEAIAKAYEDLFVLHGRLRRLKKQDEGPWEPHGFNMIVRKSHGKGGAA
ncbi:MAG: hypothetical protein LQ343_007934 [Gyalolechia ehrenbergii]|nr:MAG: hypothetical protein LQ343_007934 [Gyalolechia ehrenbergii]